MKRIEGADIRVDCYVIGIGLSASARESGGKIAEATGGEKPVFVNRRLDLEGALQRVLVTQPVAQDTQLLVTSLNAGVDHLRDALAAIAKQDFPAAEARLEEARNEAAKSAPLGDLVKGDRKEQFRELYQATEEGRRIRDALMSLAGKMLSQARAHDIEGYNASVAEFNRLSNEYNQNGQSINALLKRM
jgi:hypothetical protein